MREFPLKTLPMTESAATEIQLLLLGMERYVKEDKIGADDMTLITAQPGIMDIELYQSGAAHIEGVDNIIS